MEAHLLKKTKVVGSASSAGAVLTRLSITDRVALVEVETVDAQSSTAKTLSGFSPTD